MAKKKPSNLSTLTESVAGGITAAVDLPVGFVPLENFQAPEGIIVKSMSPMIKPADFPVGRVFVGKFTKMFETSPDNKKKGEGIEIVPHGAPMGIAVPAVATIRQGLEITGTGTEAKSPYIGRTISIQKMEKRIASKKGQAAWHFIIGIYPEGK
jgi:hypothetical protein